MDIALSGFLLFYWQYVLTTLINCKKKLNFFYILEIGFFLN